MKFNRFSLTVNNSLTLLLLAFSAFPLLPYLVRSILMIVIFGLTLINVNGKSISRYSKKSVTFLAISLLPFVFLLIGLLYTIELSKGFGRLIQMSAFFLFPIIFFLNQKILTPNLLNKILIIFGISVILLIIYQACMCFVNSQYLFSEPTTAELKALNILKLEDANQHIIYEIKLRRFRNYVLELTDTHPTYQGIWVVFTLAIMFSFIIKSKSIQWKTVLIIIGGLLLSWLFLISSRSPLIGLILAFLVALGYRAQVKLKFYVFFFVTIICGLSLIYKTLPGFNLKVNELVKTKMELPTKGSDIHKFNATNVRYGIYYCSFKVINHNMLLGVGVGDLQTELNYCYDSMIGAKIYKWNDYNTHNQFLFFFAASGIIGLCLFLLSLGISFYISLKTNEFVFLFFIISVSVVFLTENVLSRSDGVIYYSFFNSIMLFKSKFNNKNDSN